MQQFMESTNDIGEIMSLSEEQQILNWVLSFVALSDRFFFCAVPDDKT